MSAFFALSGVAMAAYLHHIGKPTRICLAILYFGAMEMLQTVQYLYIAEPEDGYARCKDPMNQFLTFVGYLHIWFQPVFSNMVFTAMPRLSSLKARIEGDLINKFCLIGAVLGLSRYWLAAFWPDNPAMAPRPTRDCPNYEWVRDGYDGLLGDFETPNLPGHSCTFRSNSGSGHLAWAIPMYQSTYFVPSTFLHAFLMFAPLLARAEQVFDFAVGIVFFVSGPVLAAYLTNSLNEQASIWCFFSMFQCFLAFVSVALEKDLPVRSVVVHAGTLGEKPMEYASLVESEQVSASNKEAAKEEKAPSLPSSPPRYLEKWPVTLRTAVVATAVAWVVHAKLRLFDTHYWWAVFAVAMALEASSPSWNHIVQYFYPLILGGQHMLLHGSFPSYWQLALLVPSSLVFVGICMSVCLHRYFSHKAFETSRPVQFLLAVVSAFAYESGPIWWAGKHGRHHHHCDQEEDPHSWTVKGYMYSLVGWTTDPQGIRDKDLRYIHPSILQPEIFFMDRCYLLPVVAVFDFFERQWEIERSWICYSLLWPMLLCRMWTLLFNLGFHPPDDSARRCKSVDLHMMIADLVGEAEHDVHHKKPSLAKRYTWDLPYWFSIYWMEKLGLIWDVSYSKKDLQLID